MLEDAETGAGSQQSVRPNKVVEVLHDDGQWRTAAIQCWHHRPDGGWDMLILWHSPDYLRNYQAWVRYCRGAVRKASEIRLPSHGPL